MRSSSEIRADLRDMRRCLATRSDRDRLDRLVSEWALLESEQQQNLSAPPTLSHNGQQRQDAAVTRPQEGNKNG